MNPPKTTTKKVEVVFFQTASGSEPVREWLKEKVDLNDRKIIGADIKTAEYGWPIGMPTCRSMGKGLHEVRSNLTGNRIARVLFCIVEGQMILLHAFIKKSRTTPNADMDLARKRMKEVVG